MKEGNADTVDSDVIWIRNTLKRYPNDPKTISSVQDFIKTHHTKGDRVRFLDALFSDPGIRMILRKGSKYKDRIPSVSRH